MLLFGVSRGSRHSAMTSTKPYVRPTVGFKGALERLRVLVPLPVPVRVTRPKMKDAWGTCDHLTDPPRFHISIAAGITEAEAIEVLAHEWAHARSWLEHTDDHSAFWGVAYSECYQALWEE